MFFNIAGAVVHNLYEDEESADDVMSIELSDDHPPILVEGTEVLKEWGTKAYIKLHCILALNFISQSTSVKTTINHYRIFDLNFH